MRRSDREITDITEMRDILSRADVCHLALVDGNEPYIVALNYGFVWEDSGLVLYFHCAPAGKKLDIIKKNNSACFMVDTGHVLVGGEKDCDWGMNFSSLVGKGKIELLTDAAERKKGLDLLMNHYTGRTGFSYDERVFSMTAMLRMTVSKVTGKKKG
jgi:nitroimidazol reductase NimA-like FMN-containing flavoprotein (pyridoxamine 5'-phosphate oxidase superfamily)